MVGLVGWEMLPKAISCATAFGNLFWMVGRKIVCTPEGFFDYRYKILVSNDDRLNI